MHRNPTPMAYGQGQQVEVRIEVEKFGFIKRDPDGELDFVSPFPCPWNYGSIEGSCSDDGEPHDAIVLGPRRARGSLAKGHVLGVIRFIDQGVPDPKVIVGQTLGSLERRALEQFFRGYALAKGTLRFWRPPTRYAGWLLHPA